MRTYNPSIQAYLVAFGLALVLPVLLLAGVVVDRYAASERARLHQEAGDIARGIGRRIDREVSYLEATLHGLSHSASLQAGDWPAFHAQASRIGRTLDLYVTLRRPDGQQVVNTLRAATEPLPRTGDRSSDIQIVETGRRAVSDLFDGAVSGVPVVAVSIPVNARAGAAHILTAAMRTETVAALLKERPIPQGWTASVVDATGRVIARTANHAELVGRSATAEYFRYATQESGTFVGRNLLDVPSLAAYSRSPETRWTVVASVPESTVMAPLRRSLWAIFAAGGALLALALGLAAWLGRRIARPFRSLAEAGGVLGRGGVPEVARSPIREADEAAAALARAGALLRDRDVALRRGEERYRLLAESMPALVWLSREDGATVMANGRLGTYAGGPVEDLQAWSRLIHPEDLDVATSRREEALASGAEQRKELRLRRRDGVYRWHHVQISPVRMAAGDGGQCWLTVAVDVEELKRAQVLQADLNLVLEQRVAEAAERLRQETAVRRKAEDQLRRTQKMEAISRLTGGIAHDFNNKLMVISANIDAVIKQTKKQPQLTRKLLSALVAADRAAALMSKLLTFARRQDFRSQYIDVAERLSSIAELLERSLLTDAVSVELLMEEGLWSLDVDPHQLETAVLNLAVNARDAMPEGGTITIEAGNARIWAKEVPGLAPGEFVMISVHDTGIGIPADRLERVMEPFFTTKESGKGTGLGLSEAYGFARQLGGAVVIDSTEGEGTSVTMYLPRAQLPTRISPVAAEDLDEAVPEGGRQARILLVEDDVDVAAAVEAMLVALGYTVDVALGSDEALVRIGEAKPDLVLTDVTMPGGLDGPVLGRRIREILPDLPVVLLTGNPASLADVSEFPLIVKPVTSGRLDAELRRQLGGQDPGKVVRLVPGAKRARMAGQD